MNGARWHWTPPLAFGKSSAPLHDQLSTHPSSHHPWSPAGAHGGINTHGAWVSRGNPGLAFLAEPLTRRCRHFNSHWDHGAPSTRRYTARRFPAGLLQAGSSEPLLVDIDNV